MGVHQTPGNVYLEVAMPVGSVRIWAEERDETLVEVTSQLPRMANDPATLQAIGGVRETVATVESNEEEAVVDSTQVE